MIIKLALFIILRLFSMLAGTAVQDPVHLVHNFFCKWCFLCAAIWMLSHKDKTIWSIGGPATSGLVECKEKIKKGKEKQMKIT